MPQRNNQSITGQHEHGCGFSGSVVSQQCRDVTFIHVDVQSVHSRYLFLAESLQHFTTVVDVISRQFCVTFGLCITGYFSMDVTGEAG